MKLTDLQPTDLRRLNTLALNYFRFCSDKGGIKYPWFVELSEISRKHRAQLQIDSEEQKLFWQYWLQTIALWPQKFPAQIVTDVRNAQVCRDFSPHPHSTVVR